MIFTTKKILDNKFYFTRAGQPKLSVFVCDYGPNPKHTVDALYTNFALYLSLH